MKKEEESDDQEEEEWSYPCLPPNKSNSLTNTLFNRDFYFRAPGSLVVLSFPQLVSFSQFSPSRCLKPSPVLERPVARLLNTFDR
jgi:hypothetical protein